MIGVPEYYPKCKGCDNDVDESDDKDDDVECQKWALGFYVIVLYFYKCLKNKTMMRCRGSSVGAYFFV